MWEFVHRATVISLANADLWWHLQTGLEILRTHTLPHTGWFSQSATQPWIASSWLYDVRVAAWYQLLGIRFLPVLGMIAKFFLAVVMFLLAGGLRGRFWMALALSAGAQYVLWLMPPLPVFGSMLAFAIELILLLEFRRGSTRALYFVPVLTLVWANIDFHFVYGVVTLALFVVAQFVPAQLKLRPFKAQFTTLVIVTAASLIATFVTPYGWKPWGVFWANATSAANAYFLDYQSLRFRTPQDYVLLLLAMAAFLALGLRRSRDWFQIGLLVLCIAAAFHSQRDTWLLALGAVAIIGNAVPQEAGSFELRATSREQRRSFLIAAGISFAVLLAFIAVRLPSRDTVLAKIGHAYPVAAADYIRQNNLPAPLFNSYVWGGFLTWYLPQYPVAIDGRTDLYGADTNIQYAKVMNFEAHYSTFPPLNDAGTILLEKSSSAGKALPNAHGFTKVYEDDVSVVLLRDKAEP